LRPEWERVQPTGNLDVADVAELAPELQGDVEACVSDGRVDLDVRAHRGYAARDALGDKPPAARVDVVEVIREASFSFRGDFKSLLECPMARGSL
jgi:hypothetical protein